jgi:hypothetical protein
MAAAAQPIMESTKFIAARSLYRDTTVTRVRHLRESSLEEPLTIRSHEPVENRKTVVV